MNRCSAFDHVVASAEGCLQRLGTDWADLLLIHWPDHNTPYGEPIAALEKLKQDGKIRHYGVSNFSPAMMDVCERAGHLAANQVGYPAVRPAGATRRAALHALRRESLAIAPAAD